MQHDIHNPWNKSNTFCGTTSVALNISHESISILIDDQVAFNHSGGVTSNDARMIRFIAEGIAERFGTQLVINERRETLN